MFIDSHAHLTSKDLLDDIEFLLTEAKKAKIKAIINICTDKNSLEEGLKLAEQYPWVFNAAATTPHDVEKEGEELFETMAFAAKQKKLVAVGETGLDYHYYHSSKVTQQDFFKRYIHLALSCKLPLIIHCRDAFDDFFKIIDQEYMSDSSNKSGVLHCFTGTTEEALELSKRGWYISFSGIITFKKSELLRQALKALPLEQILIETDSPYLAPQSQRGKKNQPAFVSEVAMTIAEIKGISVEQVAEVTRNNAIKFFNLPLA